MKNIHFELKERTTMKYRIIHTIITESSFTKAAEKLNMTQSAVSHAVNTLEKSIGFPIFNRLKSGIGLTQEGAKLLPYIEQMVFTEDRFLNEVNVINAVEIGTLRMGSFASASSRILPEIIRAFNERYPGIAIELYDGGYDEIKSRLEKGQIDIAVLEDSFLEANYYHLPYLKDEMLLVTPKKAPFDVLKELPMNEIINYPFVMPDNDQDMFLKMLLKSHHVDPEIKYRIQLLTTVFAMVEAGLGITIVPESALIKTRYNIMKISLNPKQYRNVSLVALNSQKNAPVVKAFFELALSKRNYCVN